MTTGLADWESIYDDLQTGYQTPPGDRSIVDLDAGDGASIYGEITRESTATILQWLKPTADDVLFDLGSGVGRFVMQAVCESQVGRAVGVELSAHRHAVAEQARQILGQRIDARHAGRLDFVHGDLRHCDLSRATIIWAGATCFPDELVRELAEHVARSAPHLRAMLTTRSVPGPELPALPEQGQLKLAMSWLGGVSVSVYRRRARKSGADFTP